MKKTNAAVSLITILLLFVHTAYNTYCYLAFYYNPVLKIVLSIPLIVCVCIHAVLGMWSVFMNNDAAGADFYHQYNRETCIQRISAALIFPLLILHIKTYGFMTAAAVSSHRILLFLLIVSEVLFNLVVFTHTAVSFSRALITLGWLSSSESKRRIDRLMYIICLLLCIIASAAVIRGQLIMFAG